MYPWAENSMKLHTARQALKAAGTPETDELVKREYIKAGGFIRLADGTKIDNKTENLDKYINEPTALTSEDVEHVENAGVVVQKRVRKAKKAE